MNKRTSRDCQEVQGVSKTVHEDWNKNVHQYVTVHSQSLEAQSLGHMPNAATKDLKGSNGCAEQIEGWNSCFRSREHGRKCKARRSKLPLTVL